MHLGFVRVSKPSARRQEYRDECCKRRVYGLGIVLCLQFLANGKVVPAATSFLSTAGNGIATGYAGGAKSIGLVATRKLSRKYCFSAQVHFESCP